MIMGAFGIQQATSVLVGRSLGKGDRLAIKIYSQAGLLIGLMLAMIVALIYWFCPKIIISFFSVDIHDPANTLLIKITVIQFLINSFSMLFDNLRNIATGALRGLHDTATPMWIGIIASWGIAIPVGYLLGFTFHLGIAGIASGFLCAWLLGASLLIKRLNAKFILIR
jgi:MATE family multidrug resistance protein